MTKLGSKVRDTLTGYEGIATAKTIFLYGCVRFCIEAESLTKDGEPKDERWFDEQRVETVKKQGSRKRTIKTHPAIGGPRSHSPRRRDAT